MDRSVTALLKQLDYCFIVCLDGMDETKRSGRVTIPPPWLSCLLLDTITTTKLLLLKLCKSKENQMAFNLDLLVIVCFVYYTIIFFIVVHFVFIICLAWLFFFIFFKKKTWKPQHKNIGRVMELHLSFGLHCGVNVWLLQLLNTFISQKNVVFLPDRYNGTVFFTLCFDSAIVLSCGHVRHWITSWQQ